MKHVVIWVVCVLRFVLCCDFCKRFTPTNHSNILLKRFCDKTENATLNGRCCLNGKEIIGLDVSNCSQHNLDFISNPQRGLLNFLAINNNAKWTKDPHVYHGMVNLKQLVISRPQRCHLNFAKRTHWTGWDEILCDLPFDECYLSAKECPENSQCRDDGPGLFACDCQENWSGYRCLREEDDFNLVNWMIGFSASTIAICIVLGLLQRKGIKAGKEFKENRLLISGGDE